MQPTVERYIPLARCTESRKTKWTQIKYRAGCLVTFLITKKKNKQKKNWSGRKLRASTQNSSQRTEKSKRLAYTLAPAGLEPATSALLARRSNQLSYRASPDCWYSLTPIVQKKFDEVFSWSRNDKAIKIISNLYVFTFLAFFCVHFFLFSLSFKAKI